MNHHPRARAIASCILLALIGASVGCRGGDGSDPLVDRDTYEGGASALVLTENALQVSDDLLGFDPVLDRMRTAEENAMAVEAHSLASLGGCGTATRTGSTLSVDLPAPGCTLPSGHIVSGALTVTVSLGAATISALVTMTGVSIDGTSVDGSIELTTAGGLMLSAAVELTSGTSHVSGDVTLSATAGSFSTSGGLTVVRGGVTFSLSFASVTWNSGDCYPSDGSIAVTSAGITQTLSFDAATANGGEVTVTQGRRTSTEMLPAYGACPSA